MPRANDVPDPIAWFEGMLLWPQHFQQLTRRQEELLYYHAHTVAPYHWGVRVLRFDTIQPVRGILRVLELEAILPDGLVVSHVARQGLPELELDLTQHLDQLRQRSMTIHLAVARESTQALGLNGAAERTESYEAPLVDDEAMGARGLTIRRTRPRLRLIAGDEVPEKYVSLPLTRIRFQNEGYIRTDYAPPSLSVDRSSLLGELCNDVATLLRDKASFLADRVDPRTAEITTKSLFDRHRIHSLIGVLGTFEALLQTGRAHPYPLYLALCQLASHVAAVGHDLVPPGFAVYRHDDLYDLFSEVKAYIERCIQEGIDETHEVYVFERREDGFYLWFDESWFERKLVLGIRARASLDAVRWGLDSVICTTSHLDDVRKRRVRGADRRHVKEVDHLVPGRNMELFDLKPDPAVVSAGEHLVVMSSEDSPGRERPVELVLYIKVDRNKKYRILNSQR